MKTREALIVQVPRGRLAERDYTLDVILSQFLGLAYSVCHHESQCVTIRCADRPGRIEMPDVLFSMSEDTWGTARSLPGEPLLSMPIDGTVVGTRNLGASIPALYASDEVTAGIRIDADGLYVPIDVFGSCFSLLTRYEEILAPPEVLDSHGRFPATASILYRQGLLERPLVDEYVALLLAAIHRLWPGLGTLVGGYRPVVTHDVDHPVRTYDQATPLVLRRAAGDFIRRRDPAMMLRRLGTHLRESASDDKNSCFDWLMNTSERHGLRSCFYFMAASKTRFDSGYDIKARDVTEILANVARRGHDIGIHPSYWTSEDEPLLDIEIARLEDALAAAGLADWSRRSRQHYLRWSARTTWRRLDAAGISVDSSVGFADAPGFRCGTSRAYGVYDHASRKRLRLVELPLIVMDVTLTAKNFLGLRWEDALQRIVDLAGSCRRYNAPFTLLWHNDKVLTNAEKSRYGEMLAAIA